MPMRFRSQYFFSWMKTGSTKDVLEADTADACRRSREVQRVGASTLGKGNLLNLEMTQIVGIANLSPVNVHGRK